MSFVSDFLKAKPKTLLTCKNTHLVYRIYLVFRFAGVNTVVLLKFVFYTGMAD